MKLVLIPPGEFMMGSPKELIEEEMKTADLRVVTRINCQMRGQDTGTDHQAVLLWEVPGDAGGISDGVMGDNPASFRRLASVRTR